MIDSIKQTKILFNMIHADGRFSPLAFLYMRSVLLNDPELKRVIDVKIQEFSMSDRYDYILNEIMKFCPDILGFSCFVWNIDTVLRVSALVKKLRKDTVIVLGGPEVSTVAKAVLAKNPQIDIIVHDEGEITFRELVRTFYRGELNLNDLKGITFRHYDEIVTNQPREVIEDLDSIPSPFEFSYVPSIDTDVCLETQRGCVYKCSFCFYGKGLEGARLFSMERIKKDLNYLLNLKVKSIFLMDPVFNLPPERAKEICRFIAKNNKNNIAFHTELRAELVDEEMAELFAKANMKWVEIGLQSLDTEVLRSVRRNLNRKRFLNGVELFKKYDLNVQVHLLFGLPGETYESFMEALEFALSLDVTDFLIFRLQLFPGIKIHQDVQTCDIVYDEKPYYVFWQNKDLPFEKVMHLQKISNSLALFQKNVLIRFLCKEAGVKLLDMVQQWIGWVNDDRLLLNNCSRREITEKFREFINYFCLRHNIDTDFYSNLLIKEEQIPITIERETFNWMSTSNNTGQDRLT